MTRVAPDIVRLFADASCTGWLCVQPEPADDEVAVSADEPVVAASVFKVLVALAAESAFADGRLDPVRPIRLPAAHRTPGPVGFSSAHRHGTTSMPRSTATLSVVVKDSTSTTTATSTSDAGLAPSGGPQANRIR